MEQPNSSPQILGGLGPHGAAVSPLAKKIQSPNFITGSRGWRADSNGVFEANSPVLNNPSFGGSTTIGTLTGVLRGDSGVVSVDSDVTDIVAAASLTAAGKVELATDAETQALADTARAVTPSNLGALNASTTQEGLVELATQAETNAGSDTTRAVTANGLAAAKRTIILTAAGGAPTTTAGCGGPTKVEAGTNDIDYWVLEFDASTDESAFWNVTMPDNYDGGTLTAVFIWTNAGGASTETVAFDIAMRAYADSDAIDQAYGTAVETTDTWLAQGDIHISATSSAITPGGSPAGGRPMVIKVTRDVSEDTLTGDARLLMVKLEYGINAYSD